MRYITEEGIELIKRFEGFSPKIYICPAGYPTIGYGHLIRSYERFSNDGISIDEATRLLKDDIFHSEKAVLRLVDVPLTDGQFDALVSFTFNLGAGALQRSTLRRKLNRGEYLAVPNEIRRWVWSGGTKLKGLIRRRNAEAMCFCQNGFNFEYGPNQ